MTSEQSNQAGGSLSDMAVEGTTVPEDAAKPRVIPSVPRPGQVTDTASDPNDLGATDTAAAADNPQDISRVRWRFPLGKLFIFNPKSQTDAEGPWSYRCYNGHW